MCRKELAKCGATWRFMTALCETGGFPVSLVTCVAVLKSSLACVKEPELQIIPISLLCLQ